MAITLAKIHSPCAFRRDFSIHCQVLATWFAMRKCCECMKRSGTKYEIQWQTTHHNHVSNLIACIRRNASIEMNPETCTLQRKKQFQIVFVFARFIHSLQPHFLLASRLCRSTCVGMHFNLRKTSVIRLPTALKYSQSACARSAVHCRRQ